MSESISDLPIARAIEIIRNGDLTTLTFKTIMNTLISEFGPDIGSRKAELRQVVNDAIKQINKGNTSGLVAVFTFSSLINGDIAKKSSRMLILLLKKPRVFQFDRKEKQQVQPSVLQAKDLTMKAGFKKRLGYLLIWLHFLVS